VKRNLVFTRYLWDTSYFTDGDGIDEDRKAVAKEKKERKKTAALTTLSSYNLEFLI